MNRRAAALGAVLLFSAAASAAGQSLEWARQAGGPNFDRGNAVAVDAAGNSYVTGFFTGDATFGRGEANETTLTSGGSDIFVAKYDTAGTLLWVRQANGTPDTRAQGIAVDAAGNSYVTGVFRFGIVFDGTTTLSDPGGLTDLFLAKYDVNGNFLWARQAGPDFKDFGGRDALAISVDSAGNSHITGGNPFFIAKYDTNGTLLWSRAADGVAVGLIQSAGTGISVDVSGNTLVAGHSEGSVTQGANLVTNGSFEEPPIAAGAFQVFPTVPGWTQSAGFTGIEIQHRAAGSPFDGNQLVELDSFTATAISQEVPTQPGRTYQLRFAFSARPGTSAANNVLQVSWGGVPITILSADGSGLADTNWTVYTFPVVGGSGATTTLTFEDLGVSDTFGTYVDAVGVSELLTSGEFHLFVAKYDSTGALQWTRYASATAQFGAYVQGGGASVEREGNAHVTGSFSGTATFGAGEANQTVLTTTRPGALFVAKYDPNGNLLWARGVTGVAIIGGSGIAVDSGGIVHVTGGFVGGPIFGPGEANETTLSTASFADVFVARYDSSGMLVSARQTRGQYVAQGNGLGVDTAGNDYVTGLFGNFGGNAADPTSVVFGPGEPNETTLTTGVASGSEIFLAKYGNNAAPPNHPPVALEQSVATAEDTAIGITLMANDADGDMLTYSIVAPPDHGVISGTAPDVTYTPQPNYNGPDAFTFRAYDGRDFSNAAAVAIAVTPVNDAPVADDQTLTTAEDTPLAITLTGSDVDGDPLTFSIVEQPIHGTLDVAAMPTVTYAPQPGYVGADSFKFRASDGTAFSLPALVTLKVEAASLPCGALVSGTIGAVGEIDTLRFSGQAGQIITLALTSTGGFSLNPGTAASVQMELFAPTGARVGLLRSNSQNVFVLPLSGAYEIRVRATNLTTTGSYNLNRECLFPAPSPDSVPLRCGTLASGRIETVGDIDLFTFSGQAGEIISLALTSTGGFSSNPGSAGSVQMELFAQTGARVGILRSNSQNVFVLPITGPYVIRVSATDLAMTGSYNLNRECLFPTPSPDAAPLPCGTLASGRLETVGDIDLFTFSGQAGEIVSLALTSTDGFSTNPGSAASVQMELFAPTGARIGILRSNSQNVFTLPVRGPYAIRVSATNLVTIGSYNLNRECLFITPSPDAVPLPCGTLTSGLLETIGDTDLFIFSGQAGEIVSLALTSTGGFSSNPGSAASVQMELFAQTGARVGILRSNSQNVFTLPVTGTYVIRVSATNLVTTGSYNLNRECLFPTPSPDAAPLPCGTLASGRLETVGDTNLFTFSGQAGEIVSLALASTAGFSTNPGSAASVQMELFAPTGARVGILRSNSQNVFTLPVSGPYAIRVSATNLTTVGSYELRLNCPQ